MSNSNLISVLMPVYNAEKFLVDAIDSILNQTFKNFELIIINDGSTDNSDEIIRSYSDIRIKYYLNNENKGIIYTLNYGLTLAKGKYIARMDADDICLLNRFEKQIDFFIHNPNIVVVGSSAILIDENGLEMQTVNMYLEQQQIFSNLFFGNRFIHTSIIGEKEIFKKYKYNENYYLAEDYFLWSQIASEYKLANIEDPLVKYRVYKESISTRKLEQQEECVKRVFAFHLSKLGLKECTESELETHYLLLRYKFNVNTLSWVATKKIFQWLRVLKKQNSKMKIYDQISFYNNLQVYWKFYFMFSSSHGIKAFYLVFDKFNKGLTLKKKTSFILKCFKNDIAKFKRIL